MKRGFDFLMERMRSRRPALLLGAGFSVGAANGEGKPLLLASQLSCDLYDHFFVSGELSGIDPAILRDIRRMDLKEVCTYLRDLGRADARDEFLTRAFKGCTPSPEGYHNKLAQYPWEYIFSTNIDDLVEAIYREAFSMEDKMLQSMKADIEEKFRVSQEAFQGAPQEDMEFLHKFAFICTLGFDVYLKKLMIEKMIDELAADRQEQGKKKAHKANPEEAK